ncbi:hypothetical protein BV898_14748 [Hypsibius exemplaris]|uniref:Uncharacterized protein n=1 Tax=Hypsibius exemplaris TaxID=2072580 RepID=A0A9X6RJL0_HYPEX|nr:hypothetical protein BV898_14748 [Hypsibius exemplaris]
MPGNIFNGLDVHLPNPSTHRDISREHLISIRFNSIHESASGLEGDLNLSSSLTETLLRLLAEQPAAIMMAFKIFIHQRKKRREENERGPPEPGALRAPPVRRPSLPPPHTGPRQGSSKSQPRLGPSNFSAGQSRTPTLLPEVAVRPRSLLEEQVLQTASLMVATTAALSGTTTAALSGATTAALFGPGEQSEQREDSPCDQHHPESKCETAVSRMSLGQSAGQASASSSSTLAPQRYPARLIRARSKTSTVPESQELSLPPAELEKTQSDDDL